MLLKTILSITSVVALVATQSTQCKDVHILIAVGHGESYPGAQKSIATAVCSKLSSCDYANIQYDSTSNGDFCVAVVGGIKNGKTALTNYVKQCPNSKIVLMGWSQVRMTST